MIGTQVSCVDCPGVVFLNVHKIFEGTEAWIFQAETNGQLCALKVFKNMPSSSQIENYKWLIELGAPHPAFVWPYAFVILSSGHAALVMELVPSEYRQISSLASLPNSKRPSLHNTIKAAIILCLAIRALHYQGLIYIDSSGNQYIVSPSGDLRIVDTGNIVVQATGEANLVTPGYTDPDLWNGKTQPNIFTERFSLAVILFELLCCALPFFGSAMPRIIGAEDEDNALHRHPVFIFDDEDFSNAADPEYQSETITLWSVLSTEVRRLFQKNLGRGLKNPLLRSPECEWIDALLDMDACGHLCASCGAEVFYDPFQIGAQCWKCQKELHRPSRLVFRNRRIVVLKDKSIITPYDASGRESYDFSPIGEIVSDPATGAVYIANRSQNTWTWQCAKNPAAFVKPGYQVPLLLNSCLTFCPGQTAEVAT